MMSYTFLRRNNFSGFQEVIQNLTRSFPAERTHRKIVVFSVRAFHLTVMSWSIWFDKLVINT